MTQSRAQVLRELENMGFQLSPDRLVWNRSWRMWEIDDMDWRDWCEEQGIAQFKGESA